MASSDSRDPHLSTEALAHIEARGLALDPAVREILDHLAACCAECSEILSAWRAWGAGAPLPDQRLRLDRLLARIQATLNEEQRWRPSIEESLAQLLTLPPGDRRGAAGADPALCRPGAIEGLLTASRDRLADSPAEAAELAELAGDLARHLQRSGCRPATRLSFRARAAVGRAQALLATGDPARAGRALLEAQLLAERSDGDPALFLELSATRAFLALALGDTHLARRAWQRVTAQARQLADPALLTEAAAIARDLRGLEADPAPCEVLLWRSRPSPRTSPWRRLLVALTQKEPAEVAG